jgi:hypothetical protein
MEGGGSQGQAGAEDDLGSFFAEINQIEAVVAEHEGEGGNQQEEQGERVIRTEVIAAAPIISAPVISRPAEIKNHVVYTYDQPSYASIDPSSTYDPEDVETNDHAVYDPATGLTTYAPSVPPPQANIKYRTGTKFVRKAADEVWVDDSLQDWPENDFRIFVGDLAKDVTTDMLTKAFQGYKSFAKAKVRSLFVLCCVF